MNTANDVFESIVFTTLPRPVEEDCLEEPSMTARSEGPSELMVSASSSFQQSEFSSSDEDETEQGSMQTLHASSGLQLQELLGRGSCGSVYKAVWKGMPVAVKVPSILFAERGCHCGMKSIAPRAGCVTATFCGASAAVYLHVIKAE